MLYSNEFCFVFIKSIKTASTSVEASLEKLIRKRYDSTIHLTNSLKLEDGSRIGHRGSSFESDPAFGTDSFSYNHMPVSDIRNLIGINNFESALKVSTIRNPYARLVSAFHYFYDPDITKYLELKKYGQLDLLQDNFSKFVNNSEHSNYTGEEHWWIGGKMVIDFFIRKEYIENDLKVLLDRLAVPQSAKDSIVATIPNFKMNIPKNSRLPIYDYFLKETLDIVNQRYSDWFSIGDYECAYSIDDLRIRV